MLALFRRDDKDTPHMSKRPIRIAVGADHGGYELKTQLAGWLKSEGHNVTDVGTDSKEAVDYPVLPPPWRGPWRRGGATWESWWMARASVRR